MLKKLMTTAGIIGVLILGTIIGSVTLAPVFTSAASTTPTAPATIQNVDNDAAEATVTGPDMDNVQEQIGDQSGIDNNAAEATATGPDLDNVQQ